MAAENAEAAEGPGTEANQVVSPFSNIVCEYLNMCPKFVRLLQLYFLHFHFLFHRIRATRSLWKTLALTLALMLALTMAMTMALTMEPMGVPIPCVPHPVIRMKNSARIGPNMSITRTRMRTTTTTTVGIQRASGLAIVQATQM